MPLCRPAAGISPGCAPSSVGIGSVSGKDVRHLRPGWRTSREGVGVIFFFDENRIESKSFQLNLQLDSKQTLLTDQIHIFIMRNVKIFFRNALSLLIIAVAAASCSKQGKDYTDYIPKDAAIVMKVNMGSIMAKTDAKSNKLIASQIGQLTGTEKEMAEALLGNPEQLGIDMKRDAYVFIADKEGDKGGIIFALTDMDKFAATLSQVAGSPEITEKDGMKRLCPDDEIALAFNDNFCLAFIDESKKEAAAQLDALLAMPEQDNINALKSFAAFKADKVDMGMLIALETILEYGQEYSQMLPEDFTVDDCYMAYSILFDNGKTTMSCRYDAESEASKEYIRKYTGISGKAGTEFFKYLDKNALMALVTNTNGEKLTEYLKSMPGLEQELNANEEMREAFSLLSSIDGDITIGVNSMIAVPEVLICANVKNDDIVKYLTIKLNGAKLEEGRYSANIEGLISFYYGMDGNTFYASLSPDNRDGLKAKDESLADSRYYDKAKNSYAYCMINAADIMSIPLVQNYLQYAQPAVIQLLNNIDYIEIANKDPESGELVIYTKDNSNLLKQLFELGTGQLS